MTTLRNLFVFMLIAVTLAAAADSELLKLAPPETRMLAGAHVSQGKTTPFGRFVLSQMRTGSQDFRSQYLAGAPPVDQEFYRSRLPEILG